MESELPDLLRRLRGASGRPGFSTQALKRPVQSKVVSRRDLSLSVSGRRDFSRAEAIRAPGRPRSKSQALPLAMDTGSSPTVSNDLFGVPFSSGHLSQNRLALRQSERLVKRPFDRAENVTREDGLFRSHIGYRQNPGSPLDHAAATTVPKIDDLDGRPASFRRSSIGIDSCQAIPKPDRPTTPSAIPRPSSRFSNSGNSSRPVTPVRSRSSVGSYARPSSRQSQWIDLNRASVPPNHSGRSVSGPLYKSTNIPPVPAMPSKQEIYEKEAFWAAYARSSMHTPPPTSWGTKAAPAASHGVSRSVSTPTPHQAAHQRSDDRPATHLSGGESVRKQPPPSSFKNPWGQASRPPSSMSTLSDGLSPCLNRFIPNPLDELDKELARQLKNIPIDVEIGRVDPPLRKGQLHEGEWNARYSFDISGERRTRACRLIEMARAGINTPNKVQKVMVRDKGGES